MAIKHTLALDIPETACENIIRVIDASVYGVGLPIDCGRLDIYLPGIAVPIYIEDVTSNFLLNLSTLDLGITLPNDPIGTLPDGIYTISYSVSPNDIVKVTYKHLRTTHITNVYYREICKIQMAACEPSKEQEEKLQDLRYIKTYLDAAKAKVEYCDSPKQGMEMFTYAEKLLDKYLNGCCVSCK